MVKTALIRITILLLGIIAVRACLPAQTIIVDNEPTRLARQLIIVPTDGLPALFMSSLRTRLESQHKFGVTATVQMPFPHYAEIDNSGQFSAAIIAEEGLDICRRMAQANEYCVVLTNRDINEKDSGVRFFFAQHYEGISVVSTARMNRLNFGGKVNLVSTPFAADEVLSRVSKMINKGLGLSYYGYGLSNDRNSVMFAPIMSLDDLDAAGDWYTGREVKQKNF